MNSQIVKVAIIQHAPVFLNLEQSLHKACTLIGEAASEGAKIIAFPETWLPGYPIWLDYSPNVALWNYPPAKALHRILMENSLTIPGNHLEFLVEVVKKTETHVIMGAHERIEGTLYNTTIFIGKNGEFRLHRKLMPTYNERMVWGMGDGSTLSILNTEYGTIGGLICWEHWMPLARAAMHAKHETIHIAQWPSVNELHQLASRHYAFEGQCFVLACGSILNRQEAIEGYRSLDVDTEALTILEAIPSERDVLLKGGSAIIGPDGRYVAGPVFEQSCILHATLELNRIREGNLCLDTSGHYSRPDVFRLEVNDNPKLGVEFKSQNRRNTQP